MNKTTKPWLGGMSKTIKTRSFKEEQTRQLKLGVSRRNEKDN